jgi:hypothetical protein
MDHQEIISFKGQKFVFSMKNTASKEENFIGVHKTVEETSGSKKRKSSEMDITTINGQEFILFDGGLSTMCTIHKKIPDSKKRKVRETDPLIDTTKKQTTNKSITPINSISPDILFLIVNNLDASSLANCRLASKRFYYVSNSAMNTIILGKFKDIYGREKDIVTYDTMTRFGDLKFYPENVDIIEFGEALLKYKALLFIDKRLDTQDETIVVYFDHIYLNLIANENSFQQFQYPGLLQMSLSGTWYRSTITRLIKKKENYHIESPVHAGYDVVPEILAKIFGQETEVILNIKKALRDACFKVIISNSNYPEWKYPDTTLSFSEIKKHWCSNWDDIIVSCDKPVSLDGSSSSEGEE